MSVGSHSSVVSRPLSTTGTFIAPSRASTAASTRSAVMGSSWTRSPSDCSALPIAAGTGGRTVSPRPCTSAPSRSMISCVKRAGRSAERGDVVVGEVGVGDLAVAEVDRLEQRRPEAHDQRALVLQLGAGAVDDPARVGDAVQVLDADLAGLLVDADARARGALVPVRRGDALPGVGIEAALVADLAEAALAAVGPQVGDRLDERAAHHVRRAARGRARVERRAVGVRVRAARPGRARSRAARRP